LAYNPAFWGFIFRNAKVGDNDVLRFEAMLRAIPPQAPFKKVLILGTSQAREGIDADYLNKEFPHARFYNLAMSGSSAPIDNFLAEDKLLALNPDAVIYMP